jgi:DNA-binding CsgD family transcriptional regulator
MNQVRSIANLRQLCCLGLAKEAAIPEFLRTVSAVIPSSNNVFSGVDAVHFSPTYFLHGFDEADLDQDTAELVMSLITPARSESLLQWFKRYPVLTDQSHIDPSFFRSDFYNLVHRRFGQHHCLSTPVLKHGKWAGLVSLFRSPKQKPFNSSEQKTLLGLLPYLSHALHAPVEKTIEFSEKAGLGLLVMDVQGHVHCQSQEAQRLLNLACNPLSTPDTPAKRARLLAKLGQLCRNLDSIFLGNPAMPPSWDFSNGRGRFVFSAYWLDGQNQDSKGLIGLSIQHQEPFKLKIWRSMQYLALSPSQQQVALLLALGHTNENIGKQLQIKKSTVRDHTRKIFSKLDIENRKDFLAKLRVANIRQPISFEID